MEPGWTTHVDSVRPQNRFMLGHQFSLKRAPAKDQDTHENIWKGNRFSVFEK